MRVVLLGSTRLSVDAFHTLTTLGMEVTGVLTTPREIHISYSPTPVTLVQHADLATVADAAGVPVLMVTGKMTEYVDATRKLAPDLLLAVGWYYVVAPAMRAVAPLGAAGVHASLLPRYRGGAPIAWALINGEDRTGVSLFHLADGVDDGDVIGQVEIPITPDDTCATLYAQVTTATRDLLTRHLPLIERGRAPRIEQDERQATVFPQRRPADGLIAWSLGTRRLLDWVRAQTRPYPGAFTVLDGDRLTVWAATTGPRRARARAGEIVGVEPGAWIDVATGDGVLRLTDVEGCPWSALRIGRGFAGPAAP